MVLREHQVIDAIHAALGITPTMAFTKACAEYQMDRGIEVTVVELVEIAVFHLGYVLNTLKLTDYEKVLVISNSTAVYQTLDLHFAETK